MELMEYTALVVAAGMGSRMGLGYNKMLYRLADGRTILETTVDIFLHDPRCKQIIITANDTDMHAYTELFSCGKVMYVKGGKTRQESVFNGLQAVKEEYVLIHDGARPWLPMDCLNRLLKELKEHPACLLMVPVKDTVKQVEGSEVDQTLKRASLYLAQTPQAFATDLILRSYRKAMRCHLMATDDAQVVELCGDAKVTVVLGSYENKKVTTMEDVYSKG